MTLMLVKFGKDVDICTFLKLGTCLNPIPTKGSLCHEANGLSGGLTRRELPSIKIPFLGDRNVGQTY